MLTVVSYDIPDDRRRTKLARALEGFGRRVQLSVFECHLDDAELDRLRTALGRLADPAEDSVRIYRVCGACRDRVEILGRGLPPEETEVYVL